jgi:GLPGLI family protein
MRWTTFFLSLLAPLASFAQTPTMAPEPAILVGTYRLTYQPDSTDSTKRSDIFYLLLGKTLSKFQSRGEQAADSLLAIFNAMPFNSENLELMDKQMVHMPHSRFHYTIYKKAGSEHVYFDDRIVTTHYRYEEPAGSLTWTITPITATVTGYACQRATTSYGGRQWEAWFTREVPVSEGPYKFYGLPGFIVKVADTRQHYVFELAQLIKPATQRLITLPKKTPNTTDRATFRQALTTYNADPMGSLAAASNGRARVYSPDGSSQDQVEQRARENARKRNNALELR